jgi:hypothetical protein
MPALVSQKALFLKPTSGAVFSVRDIEFLGCISRVADYMPLDIHIGTQSHERRERGQSHLTVTLLKLGRVLSPELIAGVHGRPLQAARQHLLLVLVPGGQQLDVLRQLLLEPLQCDTNILVLPVLQRQKA